ncbi:MAG: cell division protein [Bacillus thermozeamaize]|jgi:YggT family protein|uniref:Cell division protein n=1 Tax=Bacillus thermozeamaize TaxID=230954 RepID=A0A1Y3PK70_9BACI|nr:MAG: cell division protein [Bacillus thermozeamaize]
MSVLVPIINIAFQVYFWLIFFYVLSSWIPGLRESSVGVAIGRLVEPYLSIFRRFIPPIGFIDISPIVALIALQFIQQGLFAVLRVIF